MFAMASPPQSAAEHIDASLSQINPEEFELHVEVPHWQSALFGVVPSVMPHDDRVLHVLKVLSQ